MAEALLALGANVGDVRATLERAVELLCDGDLVRLRARSSDYRTPPWGVEQQPEFVNLCIAVETNSRRAACWSVHSKSKARSGATVPAKRTGGRGQSTSISSPTMISRSVSPGSSFRIRTCSNAPSCSCRSPRLHPTGSLPADAYATHSPASTRPASRGCRRGSTNWFEPRSGLVAGATRGIFVA